MPTPRCGRLRPVSETGDVGDPALTYLTIHILAAVAEHEREAISERTKAVLAAAGPSRRGEAHACGPYGSGDTVCGQCFADHSRYPGGRPYKPQCNRRATQHWPSILLTIRQRTRVLQQTLRDQCVPLPGLVLGVSGETGVSLDWGVVLKSLGDPLWDTSSPQGRLLSTLLAIIAEFERELIRELTKVGMAAAKARGIRIGRNEAAN